MAKKTVRRYAEIEQALYRLKEQKPQGAELLHHLLTSLGISEAQTQRYTEKIDKKVVQSFAEGYLVKGLFAFVETPAEELLPRHEALKIHPLILKHKPILLMSCDGDNLLVYDFVSGETSEEPLNRLYCDFTMLMPLVGVRRTYDINEEEADLKAAKKLAQLHDEIRAYNDYESSAALRELNIFIARLLFCFFAEDTGLFLPNVFTSYIRTYTDTSGSDLSESLERIYCMMDTPTRSEDTPAPLLDFPYVNGGLFAERISIPRLSARARRLILDCGQLDWATVNPDIFGSMLQSVVNPELRHNQGMHYTSVPNIMKLIKPLFLDRLRAEYHELERTYRALDERERLREIREADYYSEGKRLIERCNLLLRRMGRIKFLDPACGSGNFLIITYKVMRLLEMDIVALKRDIARGGELDFVGQSHISLNQFYGIELEDFAHEVAMLSLWLAEHQMNKLLQEKFGLMLEGLPLKNIVHIHKGNACRLDWEKICPHSPEDEVYIFGNPPYLGKVMQSASQKEDLKLVCGGFTNYKNLDYVACWFYKAARYAEGSRAEFAFVSTNSICQGDQVPLLWPNIFALDLKICFAYTSFKWRNNASYNAGVTVIIVGVARETSDCMLYIGDKEQRVRGISPYLFEGDNTVVESHSGSADRIPEIAFGSMPNDSGFLLLDMEICRKVVAEEPDVERWIKPFMGSEEFINGVIRYCLWIEDEDLEEALQYPFIRERVEKIRKSRLSSTREATRKLANKAHRFGEVRYENKPCIIVPAVSSERRRYIPMGYLSSGTVVSNSAFAIYGAEPWLLALLMSRMHMSWVSAIGGKLKTDYRYSAQICYNPFPFPQLSADAKAELRALTKAMLVARMDAGYPGRTLAELYNEETMPTALRACHEAIDRYVDALYRAEPFASDEERLAQLLDLYKQRL